MSVALSGPMDGMDGLFIPASHARRIGKGFSKMVALGLIVFALSLWVLGGTVVARARTTQTLPTLAFILAGTSVIFVPGILEWVAHGCPSIRLMLGHGYYSSPVSSSTMGEAVLLLGLGTISTVVGSRVGRAFMGPSRIIRFFDDRVRDWASLDRWCLLFFVLWFVPVVATGINNPLLIIHYFLESRNVHGGWSADAFSQINQFGGTFAVARVFADLSLIGIAASMLLVFTGRIRPLTAIFLGIVSILSLASGTRTNLAMLAGGAVAAAWLFWPSAKFWRFAVVVAVIFPLLAAGMFVYRNIGITHATFLGSAEYAMEHTANAIGGKEIGEVAFAISRYPRYYRAIGGSSYEAVAVGPAPRFLWPTKPVGFSFQNAQNQGFGTDTSISAGWVGEAWAQGGAWVVLAAGFLAGVLAAWVDRQMLTAGPMGASILLALQLRLAFWVRGDSVVAFDPIIFAAILLFLILAIRGMLVGERPAMEIDAPQAYADSSAHMPDDGPA